MINQTNAPNGGASVLATSMRVLAVAAAMLLLTMLVVTRSQAAFTASTSNITNTFGVGEFLLEDDDEGGILFTVTDLVPGEVVENCIKITHTGAVGTNIDFYGENITGAVLAPLLDVTIDVGILASPGAFDDCNLFQPVPLAAPVYNGKLIGLPTAALPQNHFVSELPGPTTSRVIRFTVSVPDNPVTNPVVLGETAGADFVWTATTP